MQKIGFRRSSYFGCFFIGGTKSRPVDIVSNVDDRFVVGLEDILDKNKNELSKILSVTDTGACRNVIGINIDYHHEVLMLSQSVYTKRFLATAKILE